MKIHLTLSLLGLLISGCATTEQPELFTPTADGALLAGDDDNTLRPRVPL